MTEYVKSSMTVAIFMAVVIIMAVVVVFALGHIAGHADGIKAAAAKAAPRAAVEQAIMAQVLKRNPDATIRDFDGFPAALLAEAEGAEIDFRLVMAVIDKESEWNPRAVSPAGAVGLMQLRPATAAELVTKLGLSGYEAPVKGKLGSLGDPKVSVKLGVAYLRQQIDAYGFGPEHLRSYNRGPARAKLHWAGDRYAEDVALKYITLTHEVRP